MDQFQQTLRPLRKIGKLRQVIDIPVFTAPCGEVKGCAHFEEGDYITNDDAPNWPNYKDTFTFEVWVNPDYFGGNTSGYRTIFFQESATLFGVWPGFSVEVDEIGTVTVNITVGGADVQYNTGVTISVGEWTHIAVVWDTTVPALVVYINGVTAYTSVVDVATLDNLNPEIRIGGENIAVEDKTFRGHIDEVRLWSDARSANDIFRCYKSPRDTTGVQDTTLVRYIKFDDYTTGYFDDITGDEYIATVDIHDSEDNYPYRYGGSFVAGEFPITATKSFSLRYPVTKPSDGINYVPVIRWLDNDGVTVRRYKLWDVTDFDYNPPLETYRGQKIPYTNSPVIEIWNIDGNQTVDNTEIVEMETSILDVADSATDTTQSETAALTIDTTLAEPIPLTDFPLEFDTQQTY